MASAEVAVLSPANPEEDGPLKQYYEDLKVRGEGCGASGPRELRRQAGDHSRALPFPETPPRASSLSTRR
jgi:hypothetical protein